MNKWMTILYPKLLVEFVLHNWCQKWQLLSQWKHISLHVFIFWPFVLLQFFSLCFSLVLYLYSDYPFLLCVSFIKDIENELFFANDSSLYCDNHVVAADLSPITLWVSTPFRRGVLGTTLCDKVCRWFATGWWCSPPIKLTTTI